MKKIVYAILLTVLFFGCQENTSILEPQGDLSLDQLPKGIPILGRDFDYLLYDSLGTSESEKGLLPIPKYAERFIIDGERGAKIRVRHSWKDTDGYKINLSASLIIPRNAFSGELTFAIIFDLENYAVELYPTPKKFDKPLLLNLVYSGMNLEGANPREFRFDYLDGEPEHLKYHDITVDIENRFMEIVGAQIPHFSRYGWTRTTRNK